MHLGEIYLQHFRNYERLHLRFSPGLNVLHGDNAQGKTNLLEAIFFLATGKSHRTSRDQDLIMEGQQLLATKASFVRSTGEQSLELQLGEHKRKQLKINGVAEKRITTIVGNLAAVLFSPDDLQLLKGPPAGRRRFLDIELSQVSQTYFHHLLAYNRVLSQRNTLLKQDRLDQRLLGIYDDQLLTAAAQLIRRRAASVQELVHIAADFHSLLSEGRERLHLEYQSQGAETGQVPSLAEVVERLWSQLQQRRHEELRRQQTLVGPHRDDILFTINGRDARIFGSQGQQRTAVLALKLAELQFMANELGEYPILLLDDVASELDPHRRNYLLQAVQDGIQTFVSCTDLEDLMVRSWPPEHRLFRVRNGNIEVDSRGLV